MASKFHGGLSLKEYRKHKKLIKTSFEEARTTVAIFKKHKSLFSLASEFWLNDDFLRECRQEVAIMISGQTNCGKSSLANELIGKSWIPTDARPNTALPLKIRYHPKPYKRVLKFGQEEEGVAAVQLPDKKPTKEDVSLSDEAKSDPENFRSWVQFGLKSSRLKDLPEIIDMPGWGEVKGLDSFLDEVMNAYTNTPLILIYVINGEDTATVEDVDTINRLKLLLQYRKIIFVCNKIEPSENNKYDYGEGAVVTEDGRMFYQTETRRIPLLDKGAEVFKFLQQSRYVDDETSMTDSNTYFAISCKYVGLSRNRKEAPEHHEQFATYVREFERFQVTLRESCSELWSQHLLLLTKEKFQNKLFELYNGLRKVLQGNSRSVRKRSAIEGTQKAFEGFFSFLSENEDRLHRIVSPACSLSENEVVESVRSSPSYLLNRKDCFIFTSLVSLVQNKVQETLENNILEALAPELFGYLTKYFKICNALKRTKAWNPWLKFIHYDSAEYSAWKMNLRRVLEGQKFENDEDRTEAEALLAFLPHTLKKTLDREVHYNRPSREIKIVALQLTKSSEDETAWLRRLVHNCIEEVNCITIAKSIHRSIEKQVKKQFRRFQAYLTIFEEQIKEENLKIKAVSCKFEVAHILIKTMSAIFDIENRPPESVLARLHEECFECSTWGTFSEDAKVIVKSNKITDRNVWGRNSARLVLLHLLQDVDGANAHLVRLYGVVIDPDTERLTRVVQLQERTQKLAAVLESGLDVNQMETIARGVVEALSFIHSSEFVAGNLSLDIIVVSETWQPKFDFTEIIEDTHPFYYLTPELLESNQKTNLRKSDDIFSLGVLLWQIFWRKSSSPFSSCETREKMAKKKLPLTSEFSSETPKKWKNIISSCWDVDSKRSLVMAETAE